MQMMMVDSGQPSYGSATMVQSTNIIFYMIQVLGVFYLLWTPVFTSQAPVDKDSESDACNDVENVSKRKLAKV